MDIKPFAVEEWMNEYEDNAKYNIAETCVNSVSLKELFTLCNIDFNAFIDGFSSKRFTYGSITGLPQFKKGIASLYRTIEENEIIPTHGAAGANHHVFYSLINPGDKVISIMPTYQQLYSIPESFGAELKIINLKRENNYIPDLNEIEKLACDGLKMICINNPNNPTGALIDSDTLKSIADIANKYDAYVLCDEVYRHLTQDDEWCESIVDLYDKGISVSSMSKVFSLAGLRLGWIASHDKNVLSSCYTHRDYNLISCGMFDEAIAGIALENKEKLLSRNLSIVRENLQILDNWVNTEKHVSYVRPKAGTTSLVYYDFDIPSYELCKDMYFKTGAFVTPGDCFEQEKCMRIGYACDKDILIKGLNAISEYFSILGENINA